MNDGHDYDIYGVGSALLDIEIQVEDSFLQTMGVAKGVMTLVDESRQLQLLEAAGSSATKISRACGGSAANSIMTASALGSRCFFSCLVASDERGHFYLQDLSRNGVDHRQDGFSDHGATGSCLVMVTPDAERTMNTCLGVNEQITAAALDELRLGQSRWLYLESYLLSSETGFATALKARQLADRHGVSIALSPSDPTIVSGFGERIEQLVGDGVHMLFCNWAEACQWTGRNQLDGLVEALASKAATFAITLGARGAVVAGQSMAAVHVPAPRVQAVDTNGAGDAFAGACLYGNSRGWSWQSSVELAVRAASQVVANYGPRLAAEALRKTRANFDAMARHSGAARGQGGTGGELSHGE